MEAMVLTDKELRTANAICYEMRKIAVGLDKDIEEMVVKEIIPDFLHNFESSLGYGRASARSEAIHVLKEESRRMTEERLLEYFRVAVPWYKKVFYLGQLAQDRKTLRNFRRFVAGL